MRSVILLINQEVSILKLYTILGQRSYSIGGKVKVLEGSME
jgi:hypothetical protein